MVVRLEALPISLSSAITAFFAIRLARKSSDRLRDRCRFRLAQSECGRTAGLKPSPWPDHSLKGAVVAFSESLTDKNGDLQAWLIGGLLQDHFRSSSLKALTSPTPRPCPT